MKLSSYKSVVSQSLHYLSRPHEHILRTPLQSPAAWKGAELQEQSHWKVELNSMQIDEIRAAVRYAQKSGKKLAALGPRDFPLPTLAGEIQMWKREITDGTGLKVIRNVPVNDWSLQQAEIFFWGLGLHLGVPGAQDKDGALLGHVIDSTGQKAMPQHIRLYKTRAAIRYHCDAADAVGLLCLNKALQGGKSLLVSSVTVYNQILQERPDLIELLYQPFYLDTRSSTDFNYIKVPPCRFAGGKLKTFYQSDYFRSVHQYSNVPPIDPRKQELIDLYDQIAMRPGMALEMDFEPGDIQLISNHSVIHARTDYLDAPESKRHLLRLWLSLEYPATPRLKWLSFRSKLSLLQNMLAAKIHCRLHPPTNKRALNSQRANQT